MKKDSVLALLFIGLIAIFLNSCDRDTGVPGGQAATQSLAQGEVVERASVEVLLDGKPQGMLRWQELKDLPQEQFGTGLEDIQSGYPLVDVIKYLGIDTAQSVTLYGVGLDPVTLKWDEIVNRDNKIILGLTHKGTAKVVAGNSTVLNRDGWVRHLVKIEIHKDQPASTTDGRIAEPSENPLHPRKKGKAPK